jgi:hypothetical protein
MGELVDITQQLGEKEVTESEFLGNIDIRFRVYELGVFSDIFTEGALDMEDQVDKEMLIEALENLTKIIANEDLKWTDYGGGE